MEGDRAQRGSRVFYPHQRWQTLDFVLGAIAVCCLAFGLLGLATVIGALNDVNSIERDCPFSRCVAHGTVAASSTTGAYTGFGRYCLITIDLPEDTRNVWLAGSVCSQIPVGSGVDATSWRGKIVIVNTAAGTFGTADNPGLGVGAGLFKMLGFAGFLFLVAMIHVDIANHRVVRGWLARQQRPEEGLR